MIEMETLENLWKTLRQHEGQDATYLGWDKPYLIEKAGGSEIYFAGDRRPYLDLCAGFGSLALGHNPAHQRKVFKALAIEEGPTAPIQGLGDVFASTAKAELIAEILALTPPPFTRAVLGISGSQAVEIAAKTAMLATGRTKLLALEGGYHGVDLGLLTITFGSKFRMPFSKAISQDHFPLPIDASSDGIRAFFSNHEDAAAIFIEPIQGRSGVRSLNPAWLEEVMEEAGKRGILVVFDEVFCGLGRTGRITSSLSHKADLICLGKALGGGMPISVCMGTEEVMKHWPLNRGEAIHTGTFFGHPLSCLMARETLKTITEEGMLEQVQVKGKRFASKLREGLQSMAIDAEIRGEGLMLAIDFKTLGAGERMMHRLLKDYHVVAIPCGLEGQCLSLSPALNITEEQLELATSKIIQCAASIMGNQ